MGRVRRDGQAEAQEAVAAHLQHDRRQDHRAAGRRLDVRIREPRVHREHRHLDRERGEEGEEYPDLLVEGQPLGVERAEVVGAGLQVQVDQRDQHEDRAEERVEEELHRRVDAPLAAPDADDDEHRDQHRLPEGVVQQAVERGEDPDHHALEDEERREVLREALRDRAEPGDDDEHGGERRQHDQRQRDAVDAEVIVGMKARDPGDALDELEGGGAELKARPQRYRQRERQHRDGQRQALGGPFASQHDRDATEDRQPDEDAEEMGLKHGHSILARVARAQAV